MSMAAHKSPPLLRDGDRLTSDEFIRRWEAMPELKHAELIDGIVYMPSPVSLQHGDYHNPLAGWLHIYASNTPGCRPAPETTWIMGTRDVPQPDITLRVLPDWGGQSKVKGEYGAGAPELVVEIAASSHTRDLGVKRQLYERIGVREYLVAITRQQKFIWHELTSSGFQVLEPDADGITRSRCFPGLWLDTAALWRLDLPRLNAVLQQGLASPDHAAFTARLLGQKG